MSVRIWACVLLLSGCDKLFSLQHVEDPIPDAEIDAAPPNAQGCADHSREGFQALAVYPALAACAGAWTVAGIRAATATCNREAGNQGMKVLGNGCSAEDLCARDWHVCQTRFEVLARVPGTMQSCAGLDAGSNVFFATGQDGPDGNCEIVTPNDVVGCGTYGGMAQATCAPLDRFSGNQCAALAGFGGWECLDPDSEITTVRKSDPTAGGGVLCCRDTL